MDGISFLARHEEIGLVCDGEVPGVLLNFEAAVDVQLIFFFIEDHDLIVSTQSQEDLSSEVMHFRRVVDGIGGDLVGDDLMQGIILVAQHSDSVIEFTRKIKEFASWSAPGDCPWACSFNLYGFLLVPRHLIRAELVVVKDISTQISHEEDRVIFGEGGAMAVGTGLPVRIGTVSFMNDEGVDLSGQVVDKFVDDG